MPIKTSFNLSEHSPELGLQGGWYRLSGPQGGQYVAVMLTCLENGSVFNFWTSHTQPVFMKLNAGMYEVKITASLRFQHVLPAEVLLKKISTPQKAVFFAEKFIESLKRGEGLQKLFMKIGNAVNSRAGFGASKTGVVALDDAVFAMGPLSRYDWENRASIATNMNYGSRLAAVNGRVHFIIRPLGEGRALEASLAKQVFKGWSFDESMVGKTAHIFTILIYRDDVMTPDALLVMAEAVLAHIEAQIIFTDVWINDQATAKFGFDPMIHASTSDLGYPVAVKGMLTDGAENVDISELSPDQVVRISIPLAVTKQTLALPHNSQSSPQGGKAQITAIVPTRDRADLLRECVMGLLDNTQSVSQIIIIDNGSVEPETADLFDVLRKRGVEILRDDGDFNFSRLCNLGADQARHPVLAFINNDIKVIRSDWLQNMAAWAAMPDVGAVGTRLLYEDGTLQHGGVAIGLSGAAGHLFRGVGREIFESVPSLALASSRLAVTGAVLVVEKVKFNAVGRFDEDRFKVAFNDIDLCLKLYAKGWRTVYEPRGEAYHLEGKSRGNDDTPDKIRRRDAEAMAFKTKWHNTYGNEAWFSPALSISHEIPRLL